MTVSMDQAKELTQEEIKNLGVLLLMEKNKDYNIQELKEELQKLPTYQILTKRIEVYNLGISLSPPSWLYLLGVLVDNPGKAVIALIDIMEYTEISESKEIDIKNIVDIYPYGFYNKMALKERIDRIKEGEFSSDWCKLY